MPGGVPAVVQRSSGALPGCRVLGTHAVPRLYCRPLAPGLVSFANLNVCVTTGTPGRSLPSVLLGSAHLWELGCWSRIGGAGRGPGCCCCCGSTLSSPPRPASSSRSLRGTGPASAQPPVTQAAPLPDCRVGPRPRHRIPQAAGLGPAPGPAPSTPREALAPHAPGPLSSSRRRVGGQGSHCPSSTPASSPSPTVRVRPGLAVQP